MTPSPHIPEFDVSRPGSLIAALPAVLGFVPEQSLVLVSIEDGHMGCVMRLDLSLMMTDAVDELAEVAAASQPDGAIAVIVNEDGADCQHCCDIHAEMADTVEEALSLHGIELIAAYVVDRVAAGGRWHCAYGCAKHGVIEDPSASPLAVAAVLDGRRLYRRRADLAQIVEPDESRGDRMRAVIAGLPTPPPARRRAEVRADIESALSSAAQLADGKCPADAQLARVGVALTDPQVRDTLYALAVGERAGQAESLWVELSRALPPPWRAEALVLLAFSAYVRGDGPLAGISLDAALRCVPDHRMAGMLDRALRSGMRPDQIRELALSGYRQADRLGVRLPPRQTFGGEARKAGA